MKILRIVKLMGVAIVLAALAVLVSGCGGPAGVGAAATGEPLSLPPTRTPLPPTATPSPTATAVPPTRTPPPPTATAVVSPTVALDETPAGEPQSTASPTVQPDEEPGGEPHATASPTARPDEEPGGEPQTPGWNGDGSGEELPPAVVPIGSLSAEMAGQEVTVEGTVVSAASFSAGFTFVLDDGSGQVKLLMWHNVYDDCWAAPGINLGAVVRATGEVGEYEGVLQVAPSWGGGVRALEPAEAWGEPRQIGSLSGADEGKRVMVEGQVLRTAGLRDAVVVSVGDDSGEIAVFIWRSLLDRIPSNTGLGTPGSRVRVVGAVEVYRSNLELAPTLPGDVVVIEAP